MQFLSVSNNEKLYSICRNLSAISYNRNFISELNKHGGFYLSKDKTGMVTGREIADMLFKSTIVRVRLYRSWNPWSRVNGYFNPSKGSRTVFINKWNLNRHEKSIANTIFHEGIHVIDYHEKDSYFGHGNNSPRGKKETAPWKVAEIAMKYY